jgi:signal peptidase II
VVYALRSAVTDRMLQTALHLILGGAIGNLMDRCRFGYVVDFLDVYANWGGREHHWPAFNVADSAICVGIALLFLDMRRKPAAVVNAEEAA